MRSEGPRAGHRKSRGRSGLAETQCPTQPAEAGLPGLQSPQNSLVQYSFQEVFIEGPASAQWPQDWKRPVFTPVPKKGSAKEGSDYRTTALISHASKVMLKILQARLQQYVNFQMFKLDLEKAEEPEIKLPTFAGSSRKQESSRKTSISALLTMPKPLTVWITINCGKF